MVFCFCVLFLCWFFFFSFKSNVKFARREALGSKGQVFIVIGIALNMLSLLTD